jgi:hypothetical protein
MVGIEIYEYINETLNKPAAVCFVGRTLKPTWKYWFDSEEDKIARIQNTVDKYKAQIKVKAQRTAERKIQKAEAEKCVSIGDIFVESSHYESTVIDFWQVVAKRGTRLELMKITKTLVDTDSSGRNEDYMPDVDNFIKDKTMKISISSKHGDIIYLVCRSWYSITSWSGKPVYQTNSYWR